MAVEELGSSRVVDRYGAGATAAVLDFGWYGGISPLFFDGLSADRYGRWLRDNGVTVDAPSTGDVVVRLRWSRWLAVRGPDACLIPRPDGWTTLRIGSPGRYTVTGSWRPGPRC